MVIWVTHEKNNENLNQPTAPLQARLILPFPHIKKIVLSRDTHKTHKDAKINHCISRSVYDFVVMTHRPRVTAQIRSLIRRREMQNVN